MEPIVVESVGIPCMYCDRPIHPMTEESSISNGAAWHWLCGQLEESFFDQGLGV